MNISTYTATTTASPQAIWQLWTNPKQWPVWDPALKSAELHGPFRQHVKGTFTYQDGKTVPFEVVACHMLENFVLAVPYLQGTQLLIKRSLKTHGESVEIEQEVTLQGSPLAKLMLKGKKDALVKETGVQITRFFELLEGISSQDKGRVDVAASRQAF
ncbi:hypothetical protein [Deinococcus cellulosilyticus]|uniref:Uncharacterized protein n=1 Tax=Deinococcus cellulosilyticus (strain DSM 18568 / NBRC 106333 / KACC 11606 / 5516J-15) TaxID=1223518 RepID=A0A511MW37_DEIC1|nr:hypothetical protein [Deinococcus cellulosilyticus]GEM44478.1 hypothetical protein DC3_01130 [Deinococcus cellulosilyticus NBRC 106333 = KACC 11606]